MQIFVHKNNQQLGPYSEADIRAQLAAGAISLQDHVWWQGQATWLPLAQTSLVGPGAPGAAPVMPPIPHPAGAIPLPHTVQTSQLAIWSLVCACLSFVCGIFTLVPALILGHMSLAEIKKHPGMQGRGLALWGLGISYLMVAITVLAVGAVVILAAMGNNVQNIFKTITSPINAEQADKSADDSTTNTDQATNAADPNAATASPASSADSSANSATATPTNSGSSTNSAPASQ